MNAETIRVATGEQAATRSRADGLGDVEVAEDAALRGEAIEIGCDEALRSEDADVSVALVVSEYDHDVGERRLSRKGGGVREYEC